MSKKYILTILATAVCMMTMAQDDLKLKLDSIAKTGLDKGIPGIQVIISNNKALLNYLQQF